MADRARSTASAARYGFTDARAEGQLRAAGWWDDGGPVEAAADVLAALSRTADPDLALRGIDRIREADDGEWTRLEDQLRAHRTFRGRFLSVLGTSSALADFLAANPEQWQSLTSDKCTDSACYRENLRASLVREDGSVVTGLEAEQALKIAYRGQLLGIAAADLGHLVEAGLEHPSYAEVAAQLTELAEAALAAGLVVAEAEAGAPAEGTLAIIAMGKCGGRELNYVSDVDVIFVGADDLGVATRLASTTMRVVGKACFEVDAALRPEGKAGALVRTLESHHGYYQKWAKTWEFQALLKARPVAGDAELGRQYAEMVAPLVWSAADRDNFVGEVQQMRRRVEGHVPSEHAERELKLGRGGLRDVEFAVQLLQLVHGRVDADLRSPSTMDALAALGEGGYVGRQDAAELGASYEFLRMIEHRLQLRRLRRTHLFPATSETG